MSYNRNNCLFIESQLNAFYREAILITDQLLLLAMLHPVEGLVGKWNRVSFPGGLNITDAARNILEINPHPDQIILKYSVWREGWGHEIGGTKYCMTGHLGQVISV